MITRSTVDTGRRSCTAAWLTATGTGAWKLALRHRLPRGSYRIYVRAFNATTADPGPVVTVNVRVK